MEYCAVTRLAWVSVRFSSVRPGCGDVVENDVREVAFDIDGVAYVA